FVGISGQARIAPHTGEDVVVARRLALLSRGLAVPEVEAQRPAARVVGHLSREVQPHAVVIPVDVIAGRPPGRAPRRRGPHRLHDQTHPIRDRPRRPLVVRLRFHAGTSPRRRASRAFRSARSARTLATSLSTRAGSGATVASFFSLNRAAGSTRALIPSKSVKLRMPSFTVSGRTRR